MKSQLVVINFQLLLIFQFLVRSNAIRLSSEWLHRKIKRNEVDAVVFGLEYGWYDVRERAARYLGQIKSEESKAVLVVAIDDPVEKVSKAAMRALESMNCSHDIQTKITEKQQFWEKRAADKKSKPKEFQTLFTPDPRDRPSRKSFENAKKMLQIGRAHV